MANDSEQRDFSTDVNFEWGDEVDSLRADWDPTPMRASLRLKIGWTAHRAWQRILRGSMPKEKQFSKWNPFPPTRPDLTPEERDNLNSDAGIELGEGIFGPEEDLYAVSSNGKGDYGHITTDAPNRQSGSPSEPTEAENGWFHRAANSVKEKLSQGYKHRRLIGVLAVSSTLLLVAPDSANNPQTASRPYSTADVPASTVVPNWPSIDNVLPGVEDKQLNFQPVASVQEDVPSQTSQSELQLTSSGSQLTPESQPEPQAEPAEIKPLVLAEDESVWQHVYDRVVETGLTNEVDAVNASADIVNTMWDLTGVDLDNLEVGAQSFGIPPDLLKQVTQSYKLAA